MGTRYPELVRKYKEKYGEGPIQAFHQNAYDGMAVALMAIEKVAVKDDAGNTYIGRRALRDALFATKGFDGMGGEITCNENGDCAGFKFAAYRFVGSDPIELRDRQEPGQDLSAVGSRSMGRRLGEQPKSAWSDEV